MLTPIGELLAEPDEERAWLVEGRIPVGGLCLIAGKPKAGKSTAARCLALAVARGEPWLGFPTRQGAVFYLGLEEKRREVRAHFRAMGARPEDALSMLIGRAPEGGLKLLREAAERARPALIIVDTVARLVHVRDFNDYAQVMAGLQPLLDLARETDAAVLLVHHMGKGDRVGGDAILGSTAIFATVDTALFVQRSERYRTLASQQRYGDDLEETTIALDRSSGWVSAGPCRREADEFEAGFSILTYLAGLAVPVEEAALNEAVEGKRAHKVKALRRLVEERKVLRSGGGKRGDPYRYAVSGSSFPPIGGNQNTRNEIQGLSARYTDKDSGSRASATFELLGESRERESVEPREVFEA